MIKLLDHIETSGSRINTEETFKSKQDNFTLAFEQIFTENSIFIHSIQSIWTQSFTDIMRKYGKSIHVSKEKIPQLDQSFMLEKGTVWKKDLDNLIRLIMEL